MKLVYKDSQISSFTDDFMRGDGVIEIDLKSNEFIVLNLDGSVFERIIFDDDFYVLKNKINEIIARKFIPNQDFFSLSFDSNSFKSEDEFIFIYINGELKKIEANKYEVDYYKWIDYVKNSYVKLKPENPLKIKSSFGYQVFNDSINHVYSVKEIENDEMILMTTSTGCCKSMETFEGKVNWKIDKELLIDICVID